MWVSLTYNRLSFNQYFFLGRTTIHAFQVADRFIEDQAKLMDENHVYNLASFISYRILGVFMDLANNLLVVAACVFAVYGRDTSNDTGFGAVKASLSLAVAIQVRIYSPSGP